MRLRTNAAQGASVGWWIVILEDSVSRTLEIVELAGFEAPQERAEAQRAKANGNRDEDDQDTHEGTMTDFMAGTRSFAWCL